MQDRVAIIGDVAGHLGELQAELVRLGADPGTGRLPNDLTVVQVGDLVHRGPDSAGVVALVDGYLREQPDRWVQLVGNHEAQYLRPPAFTWPERLDDTAADRLRTWWSTGRMRAAVALETDTGEHVLVTHAGLTEGYWHRVLDRPASSARAAAAIDSFVGTHEDVLFHAGEMLGAAAPDPMAGPVWASCATELVPSWQRAGTRLPFSQVHGHSMIADLRRRRLRGSPAVAAVTAVDHATAQETVTLPGGRIVGVDPGHARRPHRPWQALVLPGRVL